jgi:tetratricopeptide (TPR) repeat protein
MKTLFKTLIFLIILAVIGIAAFLFIQERFLQKEVEASPKGTEKLAAADLFFQQSPLEYDEAIQRYQRVIFEAPESPAAQIAQQRITEIETLMQTAIDAAWQALQKDTEAQISLGRREAAIDLLDNYTGPYADKLSHRRSTRIKELQRAIAEERKNEQQALDAAQDSLQATIEQTVVLLYDSQFEEVDAVLEQAALNEQLTPVKDQLQAFIMETAAVTALPGMICLNLKSPTNGITTVSLKSGQAPLRIREVNGLNVTADKIIMINGSEAGSTPLNFSFADLSLREQARRLGDSQDPEYDIMRGLMLVQGGKPAAAANYFTKADTLLAQLLNNHLESLQKEQKNTERIPDFEPVFEPDADNILIVL